MLMLPIMNRCPAPANPPPNMDESLAVLDTGDDGGMGTEYTFCLYATDCVRQLGMPSLMTSLKCQMSSCWHGMRAARMRVCADRGQHALRLYMGVLTRVWHATPLSCRSAG